MNNSAKWPIRTMSVVCALVFATFVSIAGAASPGNPNPGVIPNHGPSYAELSVRWWHWALSFPFAEVPFFQDGAVDIGAHQSGHVWFLAGAGFLPGGGGGITPVRSGVVPAGTSLFLPIANLINDYPCPAEFGFEPDPGETIEQFLVRTGNSFLPQLTDLFAEIDGVPLTGLSAYRATSRLFTFTADPALGVWDPCVTGSAQPGISVGYWLHLAPLPPGQHTLRFGTPSWGQDVTYVLTVTPGRR